MKAVYPGSFDPVTFGHIDIIKRSSEKFDQLIVSVMNNRNKKSLFSVDERLAMLKQIFQGSDNILVDSFEGLLVDYVDQIGADVIVKGLRVTTDFEYEKQMAMFNKALNPDIETVFLATSDKYSFISSSLVKEVASYGGDVSDFVPDIVKGKLEEKF